MQLPSHIDGLKGSAIREIFDLADEQCINLGLGMPDLPLLDVAKTAAKEALARGENRYSSNAGVLELRRAVAALYQHRIDNGQHTQPTTHEQVIICCGVQEALFVSVAALVGPGQSLLLPSPSFPGYKMVADVLGAKSDYYECGEEVGFQATADAIEKALHPDTKAIVIASPANPTGAVTSTKNLQDIAALLSARGVPYISDEIYDEFVWNGPHHSIGGFNSEGLIVGGLSKSANMMGWRIGWLVAPEAQSTQLTRVHQAVTTCAPVLSQHAAIAVIQALLGQNGRQEIDDNRAVFQSRRDTVKQWLDNSQLPHAPMDGGFYAYFDANRLLAGEDDVAACKRLVRQHKVIAIPGSGFGSASSGWIRIAYTTSQLQEGLNRLASGLGL